MRLAVSIITSRYRKLLFYVLARLFSFIYGVFMKFFTISAHPDTAPSSLVFLLHGWGANGQDLLPIAEEWAQSLPQTLFICPEAPEVCDMNAAGFQWFSLGDWSERAMQDGIEQAAGPLEAFLSDQRAKYQIPPEKTVLMGFSQGMMMSLYVGLRQTEALAGILGYSGALLGPSDDLPEHYPKPEICLVHGLSDPVIPVAAHDAALGWLKGHGYTVSSLKVPGLPHGIDESGLKTGGEFLKRRLG